MQNHANKHGLTDLRFVTIENCDKKDLLKREQLYLDGLSPAFNTCKKAGNTLGTKRSTESKEKMRKPRYKGFSDVCKAMWKERLETGWKAKGHKVSDEVKKKLSEATKRQFATLGNPRQGKKHSEVTKIRLSIKRLLRTKIY